MLLDNAPSAHGYQVLDIPPSNSIPHFKLIDRPTCEVVRPFCQAGKEPMIFKRRNRSPLIVAQNDVERISLEIEKNN